MLMRSPVPTFYFLCKTYLYMLFDTQTDEHVVVIVNTILCYIACCFTACVHTNESLSPLFIRPVCRLVVG